MKMKLKRVLYVITMMLFLAGCSAGENQAASSPGDAAKVAPVATPKMPASQPNHKFIANDTLDKKAVMDSYRQNRHDTAQGMAQLYVDTIRNGQDLANGEDAIAMFDLLFDRQAIAVANLRPADNMPDSYQCDITGRGPNGDRSVPLFMIFQNDDPRFYCPLSRYGRQSHSSVEAYLNYLLEGDAVALSQWLSIDGDAGYYLDEANRLIEHYRQYDLSETEIVNFDYGHELNRFVYRIQDGNGEVFEIFMNYGDGFSMPDIHTVLD